MNYYDVCLLDSVASYDGVYTYKSQYLFSKGDVVEVPFGVANVKKSAVITNTSNEGKRIKTILSHKPLFSICPERLDLLIELSDYYLAPRSDMLRLALPKRIQTKRKRILEKTGRPIPQEIALAYKESGGKNDELIAQMCRDGYLFARFLREPFYLSTVLSKEDLTCFHARIPQRFHARRRIVEDLLAAYPESIPAQTIASTQRRYFSEEGSFRLSTEKYCCHLRSPSSLSEEQDSVFKDIVSSTHPLHLIWGVSASGKSHILLHLVEDALMDSKKVLVLFPDNRVLQASAPIYRNHFGSRVGIYQGRMTSTQLSKTWDDWQSGSIDVLLGTRGALLLPFEDLSLILIDEAQEDEYISEHPAYDARKAACVLARRLHIKTVFASSTPPVELLFEEDMTSHLLRKPYLIHAGPIPSLAPHPYDGTVSDEALQAIAKNLKNQEKTILLSTRAGYASTVFCRQCGSPLRCKRCHRPLVYFRARRQLRCMSCGRLEEIHLPCPECSATEFSFEGSGIEKIEEDLKRHFPDAVIERMDYSTTRGTGDFEKWEKRLQKGKFDILLGNKLVTRGFEGDFSLAIALDAQSTLFLPEHRAGIKTFSRLYHFFARAGRAGPAEAMLQSRSADNYVISSLMRGDLWGFYEEEIRMRREQGIPPFHSEIMMRFIDESREKIDRHEEEARKLLLNEYADLDVVSYEPIYPFYKGRHERRILLRFPRDRRPESEFLTSLSRQFSTLHYRVDPEYILY